MTTRKAQRTSGGEMFQVLDINGDEVQILNPKTGKSMWAGLYDQYGDARFKFF